MLKLSDQENKEIMCSWGRAGRPSMGCRNNSPPFLKEQISGDYKIWLLWVFCLFMEKEGNGESSEKMRTEISIGLWFYISTWFLFPGRILSLSGQW